MCHSMQEMSDNITKQDNNYVKMLAMPNVFFIKALY